MAGTTRLSLGQDTLSVTANKFEVNTQSSPSQSPLLSLSEEQLVVTASQLYAAGPLGVAMDGSLTTSQVQSPPNEPLTLLAPSGKVFLNGSSGLHIQAGFLGDISISSSNNVTLTAATSVSAHRVHIISPCHLTPPPISGGA